MSTPIRMPDGNLYDFTGYSQEDIDKARRNLLEQMGAFPKEEPGMLGRAGDLLELGGRELLGSGAEGIATLADMAFDDRSDSLEQTLQSFAKGQREEASKIEGIKPLQEAEGIGDIISSAGSYLVQSVPEMATVFAGAAAGQVLIPIPVLGGLVGGTVAGIVPFLGRNTEEFKQVQGRAPNAEEGLNLLATATVQSGLNTLITRLVPFKGSPKISANMVKKGLAGTGLEASTELGQDVLQILSANNFDTSALMTDESIYRLTESFLAGGAVGGTLGVTTAPFTTDKPTPDTDLELRQAAQDFVAGREAQAVEQQPVTGQLEGRVGTEGEQQDTTFPPPPTPSPLETPRTPSPFEESDTPTRGPIQEPMAAGVARTTARGMPSDLDLRAQLDAFLNKSGTEESTILNQDGSVNEEATQLNLDKFNSARDYIMGRLDKMAERGKQGAELADKVRGQVVENEQFGAKEIEAAFLAADAITDTLGGDAQIEVNFHDSLFGEKTGQRVAGMKKYVPTPDGKLKAVMDLAFGQTDQEGNYVVDPDPQRLAGTASHEAFHFLQDFYAEHSPSDARLLKSVYKMKDGKVNYKALPGSIRQLWKKYGVDDAHRRALNGTMDPSVMSSPAEFQAMTFEFYKRAKQAGVKSPLSGSYGNFFDFIYRFLPRLKNSLMGRGFQTSEDLFTRVGQGRTQVGGQELSPRAELTGVEEALVVPTNRTNVGLQKRFNITNPAVGGNYVTVDENFNPTGDVTGKTFTGVQIEVQSDENRLGPKANMDKTMQTSDKPSELAKQEDFGKDKVGRVVNLVNPSKKAKKRFRWDWIDRDNDTDPVHNLISVVSTNNLSIENGGPTKIADPKGDHLYALRVDMDGPTKMATFPDAPSEPRLRPVMYAENLVKGPVAGRIRMRQSKKEHPVYEYIRLVKEDGITASIDNSVGTEESLRAILDKYKRAMNNPETDVETRGAGVDAAGKLSVIFGFESTQPMQYTATFTPKPDFMETGNVSSDLADILATKFDMRQISEADRKVLKDFLTPQFFEAIDQLEYNIARDEISYNNMVNVFTDMEGPGRGEDTEVYVATPFNIGYDRQRDAFFTRNRFSTEDDFKNLFEGEEIFQDIPFLIVTRAEPDSDGNRKLGFHKVMFDPTTQTISGMPYRSDFVDKTKDLIPPRKADTPREESVTREVEFLFGMSDMDLNDSRDFVELRANPAFEKFAKQFGEEIPARVMTIDFKVDNQWSKRGADAPMDGNQLRELYARMLSSLRKSLDTLELHGQKLDGIAYSGNDIKKQKMYNAFFNSDLLKKEFPEFGDGFVSKIGGGQHSFISVKQDYYRDKFDSVENLGQEESIRLDRVQDISQSPMQDVNNEVAERFGLDEGMRRRSSLDILYGDFDPQLPKADKEAGRDNKKRGRGRNTSEAARMLRNRSVGVMENPVTLDNRSPEEDEKMSRILAAETVAAMQNNPDTNAQNWYTENIRNAIESVSQIYPEVASDPEHRSAFSLALAITSQGIKVSRNSRIGLSAYEFWRDNGRFPIYGEGKSSPAIQKNFENANILLDAFKNNNESFADFLSTQFTVRDLRGALEGIGINTGKGGLNLSGELQDSMVYGSFMFGPKIGQGFYQNLMGNFDPITIDLWFMRTWGRLTGSLIGNPEAYEKNLQEMRNEMRKDGIEFDEKLFGTDEQYTFDKITEENERGERIYKEQQAAGVPNADIVKPEVTRAAGRALNNGVKPKDSPAGGQQRQHIRDVVSRAREILAENGINLTSADMQAILWYPEKDLYAKMTQNKKAGRLNESYEDTFKEIVDDKARVRTVDGASGPDPTRQDIDKADAKNRPATSEAVQGTEESLIFSAPDYRSTPGMREVMANPDTKSVGRSIMNFIKTFFDGEGRAALGRKFVNEFVHGLAPLKRRELALQRARGEGNTLMSFGNGAFKITEVAQQISGKMEMIAKYGAPVLNEDGTVTISEGTRGLFDIFRPIGSGDKYAKFQMYVYAQRAQRLKEEGRENLMTDAQIAEGMRYGSENPEFGQVFAEYKSFNETLMQFLKDTGSIDEETKQKLIGTADYVPFYRLIDEEQYTEGLFGQVRRGSQFAQNTTSAFDNPDALIKGVLTKLKGGEEKIGDLYENIYANTQAILSAGMRNVAAQRTVSLIESLKAETDTYNGFQAPQNISRTEAQGNNNHFTYRENGKTKYYDVGSDGELLTAMRSFTPLQMQGILKTMQNMARFFRNAITITPGFMTANLIRGDMAGVVTVDAPIRPMIDTMIGLKNALTDADTVQEMKTIGGFGGYSFGESQTDFSRRMKRHYRRHDGYTIIDSPQKLGDMFTRVIDRINKVGEATEMATRDAIYRRLVESGASKGDAAYEALNLINYSRKGNPQGGTAQTLAMLLPLVPFLNARIQGLYRTGTAFNGESNPTRTALKGMTLMGLSLGLYALSSQEDEWKDEPLHRKLNYYIIYAGDQKFLIPKPFEIGAIFSTIPEVFIDGIREKDGEYVAEAVTQIFLNNFSFNPIPQAVSPILEVTTNRDFFRGRELESLGVRGLPTEMRAYSTTSEFAKLMGQATASLGISPIEFEQLVNGYVGSLGALMLGGADSVLGVMGAVPKKPAGMFGDGITSQAAGALGITRFVKERENDPSSRFLSEFYEMKREADEINRAVNSLREQGNYEEAMEVRRENRSLLGVRKNLNRKYKQLNEIGDKIQSVKSSVTLSPDAKKTQLDRLIRRRKQIVSDMSRLKARIRGE